MPPPVSPSQSFAWDIIHKQHSLQEHLLVFWLGPLTGAVAAAWVWGWCFAPRGPTAKTVKASRPQLTTSAAKAKAKPNAIAKAKAQPVKSRGKKDL